MELRQLRQFVVLAETMNVHRAAERLNMAQPPLSTSLKKLEAELGERLFERTTRQMRLTSAGGLLLAHARRVLSEYDQALHALEAARSGDKGWVSIGFVGTATCAILPRLIPQFKQAYPGVHLSLRESTSNEILKELEQGLLDLGIVRAPLFQAASVTLEQIEADDLILALPERHHLASLPEISLHDLRDEAFVAYSPSRVPSLHGLLVLNCQKAGFMPRIAQEAVQVQTIVSLVGSGLGIALVPSIATQGGPPGVAFRPVVDLGPSGSTSLALAHSPERITPAARLFRSIAVSTPHGDRAPGPLFSPAPE